VCGDRVGTEPPLIKRSRIKFDHDETHRVCSKFPRSAEDFAYPQMHRSMAAVVAFKDCTAELVGTCLVEAQFDHRRNSLTIILACSAVVGFVAGLVLRLPAFTILCLLAIVGYAVFRAGIESGWQITYHVVLVGIALQIGYFVAIVTRTVLRSSSRSKQVRTTNDARRDRERDSRQQG
jgi:hypothetical protein